MAPAMPGAHRVLGATGETGWVEGGCLRGRLAGQCPVAAASPSSLQATPGRSERSSLGHERDSSVAPAMPGAHWGSDATGKAGWVVASSVATGKARWDSACSVTTGQARWDSAVGLGW